MTRARFAAFSALAALATVAPSARADGVRKAAAQELFDNALKLMDQGKYADACPKLARSQELAPSGGTLLNLGDCYEKNGQTASAWMAFREAASRAASAGIKTAETAALERANRLEPKLFRVKIVISPGADDPSLEVRRDGLTVKRAELDIDLPVDPGTHRIEASATDRKRWSKEVLVGASSPRVEVTIPALERLGDSARVGPQRASDVGSASAPAKPEETGAPSGRVTWSTQKTVGVGVAGGGLLLAGVGAIFGLMAMSTNDDALSHCRTVDGQERCDPEGLSLTDDAKSKALVSTIFVGSGVATIAGGAFLFFTAPKADRTTALRVTPLAGPRIGGLSVGASFF